MKKWILPLLLGGLALANGSCYYDKEDELYGGACDTTGVRYSTTITNILNNYGCITCHNGPTPSGAISLHTYAGVKAKVTDNTLIGAINHSPGFSPMPQGAPKMNACDIEKVRAWIQAGAPQN